MIFFFPKQAAAPLDGGSQPGPRLPICPSAGGEMGFECGRNGGGRAKEERGGTDGESTPAEHGGGKFMNRILSKNETFFWQLRIRRK